MLWIAFIALMMLSGCAPGKINHIYADSRYQPERMSHIPYSRGLGVKVSGSAFDMPQEEFEKIVNDAVQAPGYTSNPQAQPYIRMAFNNNVGLSFQNACNAQGGAAPAGKKSGDVGLVAVLCQGGDTLTYLTASLDDVEGPQDEKFHEFLRYVTVRLFPSQTDETRENDCVVSPGC